MPDSDFVFEQGDAIPVGSHGETEYLFHSGDAVPNAGASELVFESGTGLGGGKAIVYYLDELQTSSISVQTLEDEVKSELTLSLDRYFQSSGDDLDTALANEFYSLFILVASSTPAGSLDAGELTALSEWWDNEGRAALMLSEDDKSGGDPNRRNSVMKDAVNAMEGVTGFGSKVTSGNFDCESSYVPSSSPFFANVSELSARPSEAEVVDFNTFGLSPNLFGYNERSDGRRMWLDGSVHRWDDNGELSICDNITYLNNIVEWLGSATG